MTEQASLHVDPDEQLASSAERDQLGRPFWQLWSASAGSNLADGVLKVCLPLYAIRVTESPALVAGITFALTLPWLFFALPSGALADRLDRRRMMVSANSVRALALLMLVTTIVTHTDSMVALYVTAALIGIAETLYDTSAQSILPQIVPRPLLARANGRLHMAEISANQFVGPPAGGFLIAGSAILAFALPAGLWVIAVVMLMLIPGSYRVVHEHRRSLVRDIEEGVRFLKGHAVLSRLAVITGVANFSGSAVWSILVLYMVGPDSRIGMSEPGFGVLLTSTALGSVIGSLVAEQFERRFGRNLALAIAIAGGSFYAGAAAVGTNPISIGSLLFVGGLSGAIWNVIAVSFRQQVTPDRLLGRVNSAYRLVAWGTMPIGAFVGGVLAEGLGLRPTFVLMWIIALTTVGIALSLPGDDSAAASQA